MLLVTMAPDSTKAILAFDLLNLFVLFLTNLHNSSLHMKLKLVSEDIFLSLQDFYFILLITFNDNYIFGNGQ